MYCLHTSKYACVIQRPKLSEKEVESPETGVTDGCKLSCSCWEWSLGPLKAQPVLLSAELLLQPLSAILIEAYVSNISKVAHGDNIRHFLVWVILFIMIASNSVHLPVNFVIYFFY